MVNGKLSMIFNNSFNPIRDSFRPVGQKNSRKNLKLPEKNTKESAVQN